MSEDLDQSTQRVSQSWQAVGGYLSAAMQEVASSIGGKELATEIGDLVASSHALLPSPDILKRLEELYPGSAEQVIARAAELQHEAHQCTSGERHLSSFRHYGRAILKSLRP